MLSLALHLVASYTEPIYRSIHNSENSLLAGVARPATTHLVMHSVTSHDVVHHIYVINFSGWRALSNGNPTGTLAVSLNVQRKTVSGWQLSPVRCRGVLGGR